MHKSLKKIVTWALSVAGGLLIAFFILQNRQSKVELAGLKLLSSFPKQTQTVSARSLKKLPLHEIHRSAVIDSVVGIVEGYYVDHQRLVPYVLLDETLKILLEKGVIDRVEWVSDKRKTSGKLRAWVKKQSVLLGGAISYTNEDLTMDLAALTALVDKSYALEDDFDPLDYLASARIVGNGFLNSLDPHSSLLSSEEYQDLKQGTEGSFGGLGIVVGVEDDLLTVMKPIPNSPAALAGIGEDDKILAINDVLTFGVTLDNLVKHMRGLPGTKVRLSILKPKNKIPRDIEIERAIIDVPSVEYKIVENSQGQIAHITIESFSSKTSQELEKVYRDLKKSTDLIGIILDLRSNPGGLLDQAVEVADLFLESGAIVSTRGRKYSIDKASRHEEDITEPVAILINNQTASASEILAAALQENNRALVIGEPSFGKGSVQTIFELPADNALKLTIARYYTPKGQSIQGLGIYPDVWIQPIQMKDKNKNLFGEYRFITESSLFHALPISSKKSGIWTRKSSYKSYYLKDENSVDLCFNLAKDLLSDLSVRSGKRTNGALSRRSYILANSLNLVQKKLDNENKKVIAHLENKYSIDWSSTNSGIPGTNRKPELRNIDLQIQPSSYHNTVLNGEDFVLNWSVSNRSNKPLDRLSVYITDTSQEISPIEVLIGKLPAKSQESGVLKIPIRISEEIKRLTFKVGLTIDAEPAIDLVRDVGIDIKNKRSPEIAYEVRLIEKEGGGILPEVFEAGEKGYFLVSIENQSDFSVSDMEFGFVNLSGYQVNLGTNQNSSKFDLGKFEKKVFKVPVSAATKIHSNKLIFGLVISGKELPNPIKGNFAVRSK